MASEDEMKPSGSIQTQPMADTDAMPPADEKHQTRTLASTEPEPEVLPGESESESEGPPNGGRTAWLQVVACFALYANTLGVLNTFGAFQPYYEKTLLQDNSPSAISWIGSIQSFALFAIGVFIGPLYDAGYCRALLLSGAFFNTLGFMTTSVSSEYWQIFLAQGVCIGLGTSFLSIPSIALVPGYFTPPRRARAMGLATLGSGLASTLYPILFQNLQPRIGFPWTVRVLGFITLALSSLAIAVARPRYSKPRNGRTPGKGGSIWEIVKEANLGEKHYLVFVTAIFFNNLGFFVPLVYLQSYAAEHGMRGLAVTKYLLPILNSSSLFGRLVPSAMAGRVGIVNTFTIVCFLYSASVFYWTSATTVAGNIAFAVLYGFFSGGVVAFSPVVLTSLTDDLSYLGTRLGALSILKGIGSLAGTPIAGAIVQSSGYLGMQLFAGFSLFLTVAFMLVLRVMLGTGGSGWVR
ncbi:major facilitator superfamily domain-containing protein [Xylariomycetidae sp. FL0641]|nr:major facilitator superfamily domain-containing protein [Xylariomycetidae sp. FL0641]